MPIFFLIPYVHYLVRFITWSISGISIFINITISIFVYYFRRIIISCPEVILPCQRIILLSRITETVMYLFFTAYGISECIIFIMVKYLRLYVLLWEFSAFLVLTIDDMGDTSLLIRYIVIGILYPFDVGIKRCYDCMD